MLLKDIKSIKTFEVSYEIQERFNISSSEMNLDEFNINLNNKTINLNDLESTNKLYVYDKNLDKLAFDITINNSNDTTKIINKMVDYIDNYYSEKGYTGIVVTNTIIQLDGFYHTEPNSIIFIKDSLVSKNIDTVLYLPDNTTIALSENGEEFNLNKEDFVPSEIYFI